MDLNDFQSHEEEEPPKLGDKWNRESLEPQNYGPCSHCGKWIDKKSFQCLYCGERVFEDSGFLGRILIYFKGDKAWTGLFLALMLIFLWLLYY